jgi:hypothetical protein
MLNTGNPLRLDSFLLLLLNPGICVQNLVRFDVW